MSSVFLLLLVCSLSAFYFLLFFLERFFNFHFKPSDQLFPALPVFFKTQTLDPSPPPPLLAPMAHPPSPPPSRRHNHHLHPRLPVSVDQLLDQICRERGTEPADAVARRALSELGEEAALEVLWQIIGTREIKNLSKFIVYMAKHSQAAMTKNHDVISTQESACCSGPPSSPGVTSGRAEEEEQGECWSSREVLPRAGCTHLEALGELEFRKAFLILSYIGREKLEAVMSVDMIKNLKDLPMFQFEEEVWNQARRHGIIIPERRKSLDWDSGKPHVYHCHVDSNANFLFKGPYLDVTRTHLQRTLGDDNVLLVKFSEESSEGKRYSHNFDTLWCMYHKIAEEGILVGLRRYHFFVFKDGGKEEKKKNPTSSPVKCYFVRLESDWVKDGDNSYILSDLFVHEARIVFMHIHMVPSMAKYMARFSLILSKTIKLDIDLSTISIKEIEDIPCKDDAGDVVYDNNGEPMIHTDGTGFISEDLAMGCPNNIFKGKCLIPIDIQRILDGSETLGRSSTFRRHNSITPEVPLLIQFRMFYNGIAVKGTLLVNKQLPPRTIQIRPSMIKVRTDASIGYIKSCDSFEVVGASNHPKRTCLSRYLISLLHYGGVPKEYFLELLADALNDAQNATSSKQFALKVSLRYGEMDDFLATRMILCGIPLDEPYLQNRLSILMNEERKSLKAGKIPISECYYLMGTSDPTGTLKDGQVCIILDNGQISGKVLVYKHPGLHFGDIHVLTATYVKGLEEIVGNSKYGIFFPTKGPRSIADEMANSDFDGDMYWVSRNPQLLEFFRSSPPWVPTSSSTKLVQARPTEFSDRDLERILFQQFLDKRFKPSYAISVAADCWLVYMDRLLTLSNECYEEKNLLKEKICKLVDIYYDAVDAPKSGQKVEVPHGLKAQKYPHFMEKPGSIVSYQSKSVLGFIYDKVESFQAYECPSAEIWRIPSFIEETSQSCLGLWNQRYRDYSQEMSAALKHASKDELAKEVIKKYKRMLYEAEELDNSPKKREDIFEEARAIYQISYLRAQETTVGRCSFAWKVAGRALCMLHATKLNEKSSIICVGSVLREILC